MDKITAIIRDWEESRYDDDKNNTNIYLDDTHYNRYFRLENIEGLIENTFEYIYGEYGLERAIYYNVIYNDDILYIDFDNLKCENISANSELGRLVSEKNLTVYNTSIYITSSSYLKPIAFLLFSRYYNIPNICYIFHRLVWIISYIIPQHITLTRELDCDILSLPFSTQFFVHFNFNKPYYSQLEKCPRENKP